ncbi:MAG TPA: hypothetical protein VH186_33665 [Chloroflexia bacterium]|nr:hypothetical protein [Chloroflexia bacterium]
MARLFFVLLILSFILTACGSDQNANSTVSNNAAAQAATTHANSPIAISFPSPSPLPDTTGLTLSSDGNWARLYPASLMTIPTPTQDFVTPQIGSKSISALTGISCPSTFVCYLSSVNGTIFNTTDGGRNWKLLFSSSESLLAISCSSEKSCSAISGEGLVISTNNAGVNWKEQHLTLRQFTALKVITCPGINTCFIGGTAGTFFTTLDSGNHWNSYDSGTVAYFNSIACPTDLICLAVGNGPPGGITLPPNVDYRSINHVIIVTHDGGRTWTANQTVSRSFQSISCPTIDLCFAVEARSGDVFTPPYPIYRSEDQGKTWNKVFSSEKPFDYFDFIVCPSSTNCYAKASTRFLAITTDCGKTWGWEDTKAPFNLIKMSCPAEKKCYAIGNDIDRGNASVILTTTSLFPSPKPFPVPVTPTVTTR